MKVLSGLKKSAGEERSGLAIPAVLFSLLFFLLFAGEYCCGLLINLDRGLNLLIYRVVVWDFLATLYALLEGIICILAAGLYLGLKERVNPGCGPLREQGRGIGSSGAVRLTVIGFLVLFVFFEYMAVTTALDHRLPARGILNMARFYRIITGWFWTCFEGVVAVVLLKIYLLMKQGEGQRHEGY